ncbi:cotranscriptional regulator FAM172A homolog [Argiope bruennichi]|uniref:cotranscriptional regulator FAM172A homolog n=1 Tax=Argiope bruennichi TaxID=94029 RepID=UPI002494BEEC|nr:cotranscriptional regulator FAM172A homolog [Argiope bruennichi]
MDDTGKAKIAQDSSDDQHPYDSDDELCYKNICDEFPNTFEGFGYKFNEFGQLRHITTGEPFEFNVKKDDQVYNQKRYEALGELVTDYVYDLLEKEGGLKKMTIPLDALEDEPTTFIFHSDDAFTNEKIVILIHGSGVVRAGQWARRLIINDSLNSGTQLPYIKRAKGLGYGIIVLNTNDNRKLVKGYSYRIRGSDTPEAHANYVWKNIIIPKVAAKYIAIVAHSYGGIVTVNTCRLFPESFQKRVFAIAFTDSPHSLINQGLSQPLIEWFRKVARNWVFSNLPLDTFLSTADSYEVECVSAGTQRHDLTSWMSFASVYEFIDARYRKTLTGNEL